MRNYRTPDRLRIFRFQERNKLRKLLRTPFHVGIANILHLAWRASPFFWPCETCWGEGRLIRCRLDDPEGIGGSVLCHDCGGRGSYPGFRRLWCGFAGHIFMQRIYGNKWYEGKHCHHCGMPNPREELHEPS